MTRNPAQRPATQKKTYALKRTDPKKPETFRFTDWAMI